MHCSRHRLTASVAYVTRRTYTRQPITSRLAFFAHCLASLSKTKPCQFRSVQLRRSVRAFAVDGEADRRTALVLAGSDLLDQVGLSVEGSRDAARQTRHVIRYHYDNRLRRNDSQIARQ